MANYSSSDQLFPFEVFSYVINPETGRYDKISVPEVGMMLGNVNPGFPYGQNQDISQRELREARIAQMWMQTMAEPEGRKPETYPIVTQGGVHRNDFGYIQGAFIDIQYLPPSVGMEFGTTRDTDLLWHAGYYRWLYFDTGANDFGFGDMGRIHSRKQSIWRERDNQYAVGLHIIGPPGATYLVTITEPWWRTVAPLEFTNHLALPATVYSFNPMQWNETVPPLTMPLGST